MNDIIKFCNENQGLFDTILSLCSLLVSIIAICMSIHNAMLPYKKRLTFHGHVYEEDGNLLCSVEVINIGQSIIYVKDVQMLKKKTKLHIGKRADNKIVKILPGEVMEVKVKIYDEEDEVRKNILDLNSVAYIEVFDTENKKYKEKRSFGVG